jgi:3-methyladenine DNA glycosylase AlkD
MNVREELLNNMDLKYKEFNSKLIPNVPSEKIIGVRVPIVRKIAKKAALENADVESYYLEEQMVKGLIIGYSKVTIDRRLTMLKEFVPLIDNWAVCDCVCSSYKFTKSDMDKVWDFILPYLYGSEFEIRFAVVMIMDYYFTYDYIDKSLELLTSINSEYFYVNMAIAWAISVAFVKYRSKTLPIIQNKILPKWVHNKSIQKICESNRVDGETKDYIKTLKIK